jgi:glycerophosphoryl diester phosphodiesterase
MLCYHHGMAAFDLQGHRGARGLKPENTLPSFEAAFDLGVTSIETDVHLTDDAVPVLIHDPILPDGSRISQMILSELRDHSVDRNPDPRRFPQQDSSVTPLARLFAEHHEISPYTVPTVADLFAFAVAYVGDLGKQAGKSESQRNRVRQVGFDLELKRVPFHPSYIGDGSDGTNPGRLERELIALVHATGMLDRVRVRSFDHRCVRNLRQIEPGLVAGVLVSETAPVDPVQIVKAAGAQWYFPDFEFLDALQVEQCHAAGIRVLPWTVNDEANGEELIAMGVDGITTDYPDRLADWLRRKGIAF